MRSVTAEASGAPDLHRSMAACLASVLDLDLAEVPVPPAGHPAPFTVWRGWLAGRRLGLVGVRDPASFDWPGPWVGLTGRGADDRAVVAFGAPPGVAWDPLGLATPFESVVEGLVVAPPDVASWRRVAGRAPSTAAGTVEALAIAPARERPMVLVEEARALPGRGLEGDRYADGAGTFSDPHADGTDLTLMAAEAFEAAGLPMAAADARRNVITRGIDLDALIGRRFAIGEVECLGRRRCEPCAHLQRLTVPGSLRGLVHRGGLRADVLGEGVVRVGDPVRVTG